GRDDAAGRVRIVVANGAATPGVTDIATYLYDANGLIDRHCSRLVDGATETFDLAAWAPGGMPFRGSALVSAGWWEHDVFDARGYFAGNAVAIAAVAVEDGAIETASDPVTGARVQLGVPLRWTDVVPSPASSKPGRDFEPFWIECFEYSRAVVR
ncbi:MAG: hypothetical protein ABI780_09020, partial [Ardenticatenales bacterium]